MNKEFKRWVKQLRCKHLRWEYLSNPEGIEVAERCKKCGKYWAYTPKVVERLIRLAKDLKEIQ